MGKGLFIVGTGTDVGKTYVTGLLLKKLNCDGYSCGYYKAALSGASTISESDAGYVLRFANLDQEESSSVSYLYPDPVSPHLAAKFAAHSSTKSSAKPVTRPMADPEERSHSDLAETQINIDKIVEDYNRVAESRDWVIVEGSGGIVCPLRWDSNSHIMLEDIVNCLHLPTLVVADAGLGTINATVLTCHYMKSKSIPIAGIFINRYNDTLMERNNMNMISQLTGVPIVGFSADDEQDVNISSSEIIRLFE